MTKKERNSLRTRLRVDTRVSHDELDKEVSRFDLTTHNGFMRFLRMHASAFRALSRHPMSQLSADMVHDLLERIESDLDQMGGCDDDTLFEINALHPLAIDYVVAGSRLGTQVLKKRWLCAMSPTVRCATAYFSAPSYIKVWTAICATAEAMSATGLVADQIVRDTDRIFRLYRECLRPPSMKAEAIHA